MTRIWLSLVEVNDLFENGDFDVSDAHHLRDVIHQLLKVLVNLCHIPTKTTAAVLS